MAVEQRKDFTIVSKKGFNAVGYKWEGTFADAAEGGIHKIQTELKERLDEIEGKVESEVLLGLSYHFAEKDGFTHYACVEVTNTASIPDGMISITVPAARYAMVEHEAGGNIEESYNRLYTWIHESNLKAANTGLTHFEKYPMAQDPNTKAPAFTIMIPIEAE